MKFRRIRVWWCPGPGHGHGHGLGSCSRSSIGPGAAVWYSGDRCRLPGALPELDVRVAGAGSKMPCALPGDEPQTEAAPTAREP